ncbi:hypothetical protein [Streptomyces purpureus]|uniref:hypothetical protein n=1 Tax=Streptomyces purpureus TaxID=1951 RepID=UPI000375C507|nr:hypothetical protein [Streptomyces purpureus]
MLGSLAGPASAAGEVPVEVLNGTFAAPQAKAGTHATGHDDWSGTGAGQTGGAVFAADLAGHPGAFQAATLNWNGDLTVSTRLWGVKKSAVVRVAWDDSPSTYAQCTATQLAAGQKYRVMATGGESQAYTTEPSTKVGSAKWATGRTYSFTAGENNPLVSFVSEEKGANRSCGPLVTRVTGEQVPAPVDTSVKKTVMPLPEAYDLHTVIEPALVVTHCNTSDTHCTFEQDARYSYQYYDRPRMLGDVYLNCTRNALPDERVLKWDEFPYDSISQYYVQKKPPAPLDPRDNIAKSRDRLGRQIAAGFTVADGNTHQMATTNPLTWSRTNERKLTVSVQPGEVSWIEVQPSRERVTGALISTNNKYRMDVMLDTPSQSLADRFYQRTGPLSRIELDRCGDHRLTAVTPDNAAGAPTLKSTGKKPLSP